MFNCAFATVSVFIRICLSVSVCDWKYIPGRGFGVDFCKKWGECDEFLL